MSGDSTSHRDPMRELLAHLDASLAAGAPIPLRDLLPPDPHASPVAGLACGELEHKLKAGHPALTGDDLALFLLEAEVLARKRFGPPSLAAEFARFPHMVFGHPTPSAPGGGQMAGLALECERVPRTSQFWRL